MSIELADIFHEYGQRFRYKNNLSVNQLKAMRSIEICRTAVLGGHVDECDHCGKIKVSYNSCRNRHCPKCQYTTTARWIEDRKKDILPVHYFHAVFTIPEDLNHIALVNQKVIYAILFKSVSETLMVLSADTKHLGAEPGIIAILHTWGQTIMYHPHIHCLVTGGGPSPGGKEWIRTRDNYFIPVKVLSSMFRGKFLYYLREAYEFNRLRFTEKIKYLQDPYAFNKHIRDMRKKNWVVYCKPPFKHPNTVLEYLGRYTHRIAISNNRILRLEKGYVYFKWKDYKDKNKWKVMKVTVFEFIRRFLLHVLPDGFMKIRYYGLIANRKRKTKIKECRDLLKVKTEESKNSGKKKSWQDILYALTGIDVSVCPFCKKGRMRHKETIPAQIWRPPGMMRCAV